MTDAAHQPALPTAAPPLALRDRLALFARDIKLSHTVFAMPWAVLAPFIADGRRRSDNLPLRDQRQFYDYPR